MKNRHTQGLVDSWTIFVEDAADSLEELLDDVERRIEAAALPDAGVSLSGDSLTLTVQRLPDYRHVIRLRAFGAHLQCEHETWVVPGFFKRCLSRLLFSDGLHWSRVRRLDQEHELRAMTTVVRHALAESCKDLVARLAGAGAARRLDLDEVLESW
jgi:hypothetical protein